jgi:hypothetical protein
MDNKQPSIDAQAAKPTLMGQTVSTPLVEGGEPGARILSGIKIDPLGNTRGNAGRPGSTVKTLGILSLAAVITFFGYHYLSSTANEGTLATETKSSDFKVAKEQSSMLEEQAAPASTAVASPQEAAQIVNEPEVAKTAALENGVKPPKAAIQKALEKKQDAKAQATQKVAVTNSAVEKKSPAAVTSKDKDVNLLAAIITHNIAPAASSEGKQAVAAKTNAPSIAKTANELASIDASIAVATSNAQNTEAQLKKCNELGFFDKEVCRVKTCNNLWETNAACKATLSPNPVATAEAQKTAALKSNLPAAQASEKTTAAQSAANAKATELQLKQCADLSFFEREVCRVKTCNSQWETNAACKATLSPDPVATAETSKR